MTSDLLRLNLGSGPTAVQGWVCIDRSPNTWLSRMPMMKRTLRKAGLLGEGHMATWDPDVVRGDIRQLGYADGSVDAVYSSHTLEHIYLDDARAVLREARRVLKPGGVIRLALPDATVHARQLLAGEESGDPEAGVRFNNKMLAHPPSPSRGFRSLIGRFGGHTHLWQPTPGMVAGMLEAAGFVDVRRCAYLEGELPGIEEIETRPEGFHIEAKAGPAVSKGTASSTQGTAHAE